MGIQTRSNTGSGIRAVLLIAFVALVSARTGLADDPEVKRELRKHFGHELDPEQVRRDARAGDASAQFALGVMYDLGREVTKDDLQAAEWYRKAAESGVVRAQAALGVMFFNGWGVTRDYVTAYAWTDLAETRGRETTISHPNRPDEKKVVRLKKWLRKQMNSEQRADARRLAAELQERIKPTPPILGKHHYLPKHIQVHLRDEVTNLPTPRKQVGPRYTKKARNAGIQGTVLLLAIVRMDGTLEVVKVLRGLGLGLDENSVKALKKWRFHPGTREGIPVDVGLKIEVSFSLGGRTKDYLTSYEDILKGK